LGKELEEKEAHIRQMGEQKEYIEEKGKKSEVHHHEEKQEHQHFEEKGKKEKTHSGNNEKKG